MLKGLLTFGLTRRPLILLGLLVFLAAGLFEYNFGDSEFLMLFLIVVTLPFAAARSTGATNHHA